MGGVWNNTGRQRGINEVYFPTATMDSSDWGSRTEQCQRTKVIRAEKF